MDRFLIIYRHSGHEVSEQRALGMCWPENILAINSKNKAAAFYPTSWETETLKPTTSVREVFVKKL
ncbi:Hypothetical protein, putative [Bodo saltans]|uniref:Uncharacterized protein n=1 Tax=Bodo saltans TaxID=75058 RepID=A0A0S4JFL2_BODSA|nr:Hypothetical protein, putative [Bodo saltans]|eukprot:CUG89251.1 Hypothetical protein, putative [Bodo saltans]